MAAILISSSAFAAPAVTVAPTFGPPTTSITVSGSGFGATEAVDIYFDTTDLCLAATNSAGVLSCTIKSPVTAQPQNHWVTVVGRRDGDAAAKTFTVRTDWMQFHGLNARHTGFNPYENTINASNVRNLDVLWTAQLSNLGSTSTPAVFAGRVYIGDVGGSLYAFSNTNGAAVAGWPKVLGTAVFDSSPAVGANIVYIGTRQPDDQLYAFNAVTGATIAGFPVPLGGNAHDIFASPTLFGGDVYVACTDGKIYAFNRTNGVVLPGFPITVGAGNVLNGTVSAADGRIFEGSFDHDFYAFDAISGAGISAFPAIATGNVIEGTAALWSGNVFFGSIDDKLYGIRRDDGSSLSGFPVTATGAVESTPAVGDGQVIFGSSDHKVYSYDLSGGTLRWSAVLDDVVVGSPIIANGVVYVNSASSLYALNEFSGAALWRAGVYSSGLASPVIADGIVYLAAGQVFYAFSINGQFPASRLPGGELGVKPAISSLRPDYSLRAHL
jgi:outer membrane protein assembly factor BamB